MTSITLKGNPCHTNAELPSVGSPAPAFCLTRGDLSDVGLSDFAGKKKLLSIVPSLDTPVCATSARKFNEKATSYNNTVVLVVSSDLPFAQKRFCEVEGLNNVIPLSMMRNRNFAKDYGVLIEDGPLAGITARAIVIIDESDKISYIQLVPEIAQEPDYDRALAAL